MKNSIWIMIGILYAVLVWGAPNIKIKALMENQIMLSIDGKMRILKAGQTSPEGITLIRADSFEAVVKVDGQEQTLQLDNTISNHSPSRPASAVVRIAADGMNMYFTHGQINGKSVTFLIDTGASSVAMNAIDAKRLGINYQLHGTSMVTQTASGYANAWHVTLDSVRIGEIELRNIRAAVLEGTHPTEILLGMSFLEKLEIRHQGRVMELQER